LAGTQFDVVVHSLSGGFSDSASAFGSENPVWPYLGGANFAATRFGDLLKIDRTTDTQPPGFGPNWIIPIQDPYEMDPTHLENPTFVFQYRLDLDGTPGVREASCVFSNSVNHPGRPIALWVHTAGFSTSGYATAALTPATITVVPAPGCAALMLATFMAPRRRR